MMSTREPTHRVIRSPFRLPTHLTTCFGRRVAAVATVSRYSPASSSVIEISDLARSWVIPQRARARQPRWETGASQRLGGLGGRTDCRHGKRNSSQEHRLIIAWPKGLPLWGLNSGGRHVRRGAFHDDGRERTGQQCHLLGRLSDEELGALCSRTACACVPSFIEASVCLRSSHGHRLPGHVSNRASLPEICGEAALYASPDDAEAWFDCFMRVRNMPAMRDEMNRPRQGTSVKFSVEGVGWPISRRNGRFGRNV